MKASRTFQGLLAASIIIALMSGCRKEESTALPHLQRIAARYEQEFLMARDPKLNRVPKERLSEAYALAQEKRAEKAGDALPIYWEERGPNNVGGRTRAILIDANDPTGNTVWAGSVSGGLWRTTNIDDVNPTWTNTDDFFENLAITCIAQDPTNANIIYFGTGEGWFNIDAVSGLGIWKSTDGGATWNYLPSTAGFTNVQKLVVDNAGRVFASTREAGVQRSENGGIMWTKVLGSGADAATNRAADLEIAANGTMFATMGIFNLDGIYRSTNNGDDWVKLTADLPTSDYGRIEIACAPNNVNILYAVFQKNTDTDNNSPLGFFRSPDGGASWVECVIPPGFGGQAWYNLLLGVDPNNANRVWLGGVGLSVSDDGGKTWTSIGGIHSDHHTVVFEPGSSSELILSNDGGVYKCTNGADANPTPASKNAGYNVTQFYAVALHPDAGSNYMLAGAQDNGTPRFSMAGLGSTVDVSGGDGAICLIDQGDPSVQIAPHVQNQYSVSTDGGGSWSYHPFEGGTGLFINPTGYDTLSRVMYASRVGGDYLRWNDVASAGNSWDSVTVANFNGAQVTTIAVSPNVANRVYFGLTSGAVVYVDNAQSGTTQTGTIVKPAPVAAPWTSCVAIEYGNENHLLVTYSNYGVNSIWESTDGGATWNSVEGDMPDIPVRWVIFNPFDNDQALIATELGVWTSADLNNGDTHWFPTNNFGLANVRVDMLQYRYSDHLVAAATHGRGLYTTDYFTLLGSCPDNLTIGGGIAPGIYVAKEFISSNGNIASGDKVIFHAGDYIELMAGFTAVWGSDFWALILGCGYDDGSLKPGEEEEEEKMAENPTSPFPPKAPGENMEEYLKHARLDLHCYPNPSRQAATIAYQLPQDAVVTLTLTDITGKPIKKLVPGVFQTTGAHEIPLQVSELSAGFYFLVLKAGGRALTEKIMVVN